MHLEAPWGAPCHVVWSRGHPAQQAACQRPSVSCGEGEAPQGGPFSQHWVGMPGSTKTQCTSEMVYVRDGVGVVSAWLLQWCWCGPTAGMTGRHRTHPLLPTGVGWCHREQDKLFKGACSRRSGGKEKRARNEATISCSSLRKPCQKNAKLQWANWSSLSLSMANEADFHGLW